MPVCLLLLQGVGEGVLKLGLQYRAIENFTRKCSTAASASKGPFVAQ